MKKNLFYALALLTLASCGGKDKATALDSEEKAEQVKTTILAPREIAREISISTNLQGYQTVNVAPSLQGKIEHIYVEVGDKKAEGDMLVRMDENQYKTTKLAMGNLQIELNRLEALLSTGSVAQQQYDQLKLSYDQTKENLEFLEKNTYVKAPFTGVISAKNYEDGELYAGQAIVVLTQINKLKALVAIPETYFPLVKTGMKLTVASEIYPGQTFPATIEVVYPTIDPATHTFQAKVVIPNGSEKLRPGMYVTTTLGLGKQEAIVVPYQSVEKLVGSNDRYVFINENGRAKRVAVKLGQRFDQDIEIIAPEITAGVEMVTTGQNKLVDGELINVVE